MPDFPWTAGKSSRRSSSPLLSRGEGAPWRLFSSRLCARHRERTHGDDPQIGVGRGGARRDSERGAGRPSGCVSRNRRDAAGRRAAVQFRARALLPRRDDRDRRDVDLHDARLERARRLGRVRHRAPLRGARAVAHPLVSREETARDPRRDHGDARSGDGPPRDLRRADGARLLGREQAVSRLPRLHRLALDHDGTRHARRRRDPAVALPLPLHADADRGDAVVHEHGHRSVPLRRGTRVRLGDPQVHLAVVRPRDGARRLLGGPALALLARLRVLAVSLRRVTRCSRTA